MTSYGSAQDILTALSGYVREPFEDDEADFSDEEESKFLYTESPTYFDFFNFSEHKKKKETVTDNCFLTRNSTDPKQILSQLRKESDVQNNKPSYVIDVESNRENPNECSICLEDSETGHFVELACRHRFCLECVRSYLVVKINENDVPLRHKMVCIRREGQALVMSVNTRLGVVCPHHSCSRVIEQSQIQSIVDHHTYTKFDRSLFLQTLYQMNDITPCSFGCGSFLQDDCLCTNTECRQKQLKMREREARRRKFLSQLGESRFKYWAKKSSVKCCPKCFNHIEKNGGCDHMYCIRCQTRFNWSEAPTFSLVAWEKANLDNK